MISYSVELDWIGSVWIGLDWKQMMCHCNTKNVGWNQCRCFETTQIIAASENDKIPYIFISTALVTALQLYFIRLQFSWEYQIQNFCHSKEIKMVSAQKCVAPKIELTKRWAEITIPLQFSDKGILERVWTWTFENLCDSAVWVKSGMFVSKLPSLRCNFAHLNIVYNKQTWFD